MENHDKQTHQLAISLDFSAASEMFDLEIQNDWNISLLDGILEQIFLILPISL